MNEDELEERIERCRRIASMMTNDEIRRSLELLAEEYESQLPRGSQSFMQDEQIRNSPSILVRSMARRT